MMPSWPDERSGGFLGEEPEPPRPDPDRERSEPLAPLDDDAPSSPVELGADDRHYGRLGVALVALVVGVPLLGLLVAWYVSLYGELPFIIQPGPFGTPPWAPFVVLLGLAGLASFVPILRRHFGARELTFYDQVSSNKRDSVLLTIAIVAGIGLTAYIIGTLLTLRTTGGLIAGGVVVAVGITGAVMTYRMGDRVILRVSGARAVAEGEEPELRDVTHELAVAADLPPPRLFIIEDSAPNAFSAGRDPGHAVLAVTSGLLRGLDREELQGVIAHEIAHIRNYDSRYNLFVAVLVGTTALIADGFFQVVTFPFRLPWRIFRTLGESDYARGSRRVSGVGSGGSWSFPNLDFGGGEGGGGGKGGGLAILLAIAIFVVLVLVVSALIYAIAPIFARLTQVAVSREREYLADATAVELGRNPAALERALVRVASSHEVLEAANRATAPLYFVNPIRAFEKRASTIYSTHPRTVDRINRLRTLQGAPLLTPGSDVAAGFVEDDD